MPRLFYHLPDSRRFEYTGKYVTGAHMNPLRHPNKIRYRYSIDKDARLHTAHGVWGGINPQGEIELNFYHESDALPQSTECLVSPDGSLGPENLPEGFEQRDIIRHIHSRVLLNYETARAVLEWLEDRVATLEMEDGEAPLFSGHSGREQ